MQVGPSSRRSQQRGDQRRERLGVNDIASRVTCVDDGNVTLQSCRAEFDHELKVGKHSNVGDRDRMSNGGTVHIFCKRRACRWYDTRRHHDDLAQREVCSPSANARAASVLAAATATAFTVGVRPSRCWSRPNQPGAAAHHLERLRVTTPCAVLISQIVYDLRAVAMASLRHHRPDARASCPNVASCASPEPHYSSNRRTT